MNDVHALDDPVTKDVMRQLPLFAGLSEPDLDTLYHMTNTLTVPKDYVLMQEGGPPDSAYVVVDGELEVTTRRAGGSDDLLLAVRRKGELVGEMSLLEQAPRTATVRARSESVLIEVTQAALETLIGCSAAARWAILGGVASRLRSTQSLLDQSSKLAQLGGLAADLAHEINNPAAAVRRSAAQLREAFRTRDRLIGQLTASRESMHRLSAAIEAHRQPLMDTLGRADLEDEMLSWLEDHDVPRAWELAEGLVSGGWTIAELDELIGAFEPRDAPLAVEVAARSAEAYALLAGISRGAESITERVQAVKEYAFLDQAPIQAVDLHHTLDSTLTLLRQKFKPGVRVRREYAPDLPRIEAYGRELTDVWSNLIDNALDAMGEQGELVLRTSRTDGSVRVEVRDTGEGIPPDVLPRIFEVGVTTKAPGVGSGRGLHIARNIVEDRHRGRIEVSSRPGETVFAVTLPIELARS